MKTYVPNLNTLADLIDRLIVEVNKLAYFENKKREEHAKGVSFDPELVAHWDSLSRDCCEYRSILKNAINDVIGEIASTGEYRTLKELRTFRPPTKTAGDLIADRCYEVGTSIRDQLDKGYEEEV